MSKVRRVYVEKKPDAYAVQRQRSYMHEIKSYLGNQRSR